MSVPKSQQSLSDLKFYKVCMDIRKMLISLMLRDFGMKPKKMNIAYAEKIFSVTDEDKAILDDICQKYGFNNNQLVSNFPSWLIERDRNILLNNVDNMVSNIIFANSIYPTTDSEKEQRRLYQNKAMACCYVIRDKLLDCLNIYNGNANLFIPIVDKLDEEVNLLKRWRKYTNKMKTN